ncbi:MAG: hypothetical protein QXG98_03670 [Candidatus Micrarchaeia archaeon]
MRAQASLEFLFLLAAFLSFLALLLPAINDFQKAASTRLDAELALLVASDIAGAASEVCAAGEGSERELVVRLGRHANIYGDGRFVVVRLPSNLSFARAGCVVDGFVSVNGTARLKVRNEGGLAKLGNA